MATIPENDYFTLSVCTVDGNSSFTITNEGDLCEFELVCGTFIAQMKLMKNSLCVWSRYNWRCERIYV